MRRQARRHRFGDLGWKDHDPVPWARKPQDLNRQLLHDIRVGGVDEAHLLLEAGASGLEARVIQHEMDHLDGILILERTSRDQRKEAMRTLRERLEAA